jgi:hypothetical protein
MGLVAVAIYIPGTGKKLEVDAKCGSIAKNILYYSQDFILSNT